MLNNEFDNAASWVLDRMSRDLVKTVSSNDLINAFAGLKALSAKASATFLIPDLFPGVPLEMLFVHDTCNTNRSKSETAVLGEISPLALTAIGSAIMTELQSTNTDMVQYPLGGEAEVIVFLPASRSTVLHATGTTLLT